MKVTERVLDHESGKSSFWILYQAWKLGIYVPFQNTVWLSINLLTLNHCYLGFEIYLRGAFTRFRIM